MNFGGKIQRIGIQRAFVTYIYNLVMYKKQSYSQFLSLSPSLSVSFEGLHNILHNSRRVIR